MRSLPEESLPLISEFSFKFAFTFKVSGNKTVPLKCKTSVGIKYWKISLVSLYLGLEFFKWGNAT